MKALFSSCLRRRIQSQREEIKRLSDRVWERITEWRWDGRKLLDLDLGVFGGLEVGAPNTKGLGRENWKGIFGRRVSSKRWLYTCLQMVSFGDTKRRRLNELFYYVVGSAKRKFFPLLPSNLTWSEIKKSFCLLICPCRNLTCLGRKRVGRRNLWIWNILSMLDQLCDLVLNVGQTSKKKLVN